MSIQKGSYVVAKVEKKPLLLRIDSVEENGDIVCTIEKTRHKDPERVSVRKNEVLAMLGKTPKYGSVHGVTVETFKSVFTHDIFGQIVVFNQLEDKHWERLLRGLDKSGSILQKHGVDKFLPCNVEIRAPKGKVAGSYKFSGKDQEEYPDTMILRPKEEHDSFIYVILHESGHGTYFRQFRSKKGRAAWIKAYHSYISVVNATDEDIQSLVETYLLKNRPSDAKSLMSEEETEIFEAMVSYVKRVHNLSMEDLDTLFDSEEPLVEYWPETAEFTHKTYDITEYAMKSVKEFFAECFALYLTDKKLPPKIHKLMEKSLQAASNSRF